jgi:hypothetical protein
VDVTKDVTPRQHLFIGSLLDFLPILLANAAAKSLSVNMSGLNSEILVIMNPDIIHVFYFVNE